MSINIGFIINVLWITIHRIYRKWDLIMTLYMIHGNVDALYKIHFVVNYLHMCTSYTHVMYGFFMCGQHSWRIENSALCHRRGSDSMQEEFSLLNTKYHFRPKSSVYTKFSHYSGYYKDTPLSNHSTHSPFWIWSFFSPILHILCSSPNIYLCLFNFFLDPHIVFLKIPLFSQFTS